MDKQQPTMIMDAATQVQVPEPSLAGIISVGVMYCFTVPLALLSLFSFVRLRKEFPLNGRDFGLMLAFWVRYC